MVSRRTSGCLFCVLAESNRCDPNHKEAAAHKVDLSRNQAAVEHLIGDRWRDLVDKRFAYLGITLKKLYRSLFFDAGRRLLRSFLPEFLAGCLLILGDHLVCDPVNDRMLLRRQNDTYNCD